MQVQEIMNADVLSVEPGTTLREAAQRMSERNAGAALVVDTATGSRPAIITERDMLNAVAAGQDPEVQEVADNATQNPITVPVDSSLEQAVKKMEEGSFRHLLVVHGDDTVGIISMHDLVLALANS